MPPWTLYCSMVWPERFFIVVKPRASASDIWASPSCHNWTPGWTNLIAAFNAFCAALMWSLY